MFIGGVCIPGSTNYGYSPNAIISRMYIWKSYSMIAYSGAD